MWYSVPDGRVVCIVISSLAYIIYNIITIAIKYNITFRALNVNVDSNFIFVNTGLSK